MKDLVFVITPIVDKSHAQVFVITPIVDKSHAQTLQESMEPLQLVDQGPQNN